MNGICKYSYMHFGGNAGGMERVLSPEGSCVSGLSLVGYRRLSQLRLFVGHPGSTKHRSHEFEGHESQWKPLSWAS